MSALIYNVAQSRLKVATFLNRLPVIGYVGRVVNRAFWSFTDFIQGAPNHRPLPRPQGPVMLVDEINKASPEVQEACIRMVQGPVKRYHLSRLKEIDPDAYQAYVEMLVEDCQDEFTLGDDGKLQAHSEYGTLEWLPEVMGGCWEDEGNIEEYEDELPEEEDEDEEDPIH